MEGGGRGAAPHTAAGLSPRAGREAPARLASPRLPSADKDPVTFSRSLGGSGGPSAPSPGQEHPRCTSVGRPRLYRTASIARVSARGQRGPSLRSCAALGRSHAPARDALTLLSPLLPPFPRPAGPQHPAPARPLPRCEAGAGEDEEEEGKGGGEGGGERREEGSERQLALGHVKQMNPARACQHLGSPLGAG
ncbi:atherin-like [Pogoniulus pusillus]|uniref:atherin-like n=1 Tax=Pogoniulus pusillus TaxID=488313 RepID=UPI0030B9916F